MSKIELRISLIVCFLSFVSTYNQDQCVTSTAVLDDTTLLTNYTGSATGMANLTSNWYKMTASYEGVMVRECPKGYECGTSQQAWMLGSLPPADRTVVYNITICIRRGGNCCARNFTIEMMNCLFNLLFHLVPLRDDERYCFYASTFKLNPMKTMTAQPTSAITTSIDTLSDKTTTPVGIIAGITATVLFTAGVTCAVVFLKIRHKRKTIPSDGKQHVSSMPNNDATHGHSHLQSIGIGQNCHGSVAPLQHIL